MQKPAQSEQNMPHTSANLTLKSHDFMFISISYRAASYLHVGFFIIWFSVILSEKHRNICDVKCLEEQVVSLSRCILRLQEAHETSADSRNGENKTPN